MRRPPTRTGGAAKPPAPPWNGDSSEHLDVRYAALDPFGPLDSEDIDWLKEQEARRVERQRRRCRHCGTEFHPVSPYAEECPALAKHERRCSSASTDERAFYAAHRRWPRRDQVNAGSEEAA